MTYDGGDAITLLTINASTPDQYNKTVSLKLKNPAGAKVAQVTWDTQGKNAWWWAIDNIVIK